ncbi:MAG TPA: peptidase inhibitor family I36 protein [Flexivirga sp.]|uniref:peptidase inhibitor family I36 protein n=1 Tax=Flexivirga sp. TaxID=1962927 RepID=UPI002B7A3174|nr:peptidase inhibitor family I36 protein [Flexivirga sp.]HWC22226.1 peptidase inhibitor family I36 protein [Flexivirga sp.]
MMVSTRSRMNRTAALVGVSAMVAGATFTMAMPAAHAATARNGVCESGEFCLYYNSYQGGSVSDFSTSVSNYGTDPATCYVFKGTGAGKGLCVKNNAASVWNRTSKTVYVYYNSGYAGSKQSFASGVKANLNSTLKNNNASHHIGAITSTCKNTFGNPRTCAEAVTWAKNHLGSTSFGTGWCDHVVGLAYGWSSSGSSTAYIHWTQVPAVDKHAGVRTVPAGGLAFFKGGSSGAGHVMLSLGGGVFASTDVGTDGRYQAGHYNKTTIATIESSFGETYLGWTQPWFNH